MKKMWMKFLSGALMLAVFLGSAVAADNGCDNPDNEMITPELALCSTHVYNLGQVTNPSAADRALMQDVIAMKTTLITQQMYRQYEQMESMLNRLKTQMEKAIFTANVQVASGGASSDSGSGGSYKSNDRHVYLDAGVSNCLNKFQDADILKCYEENLNTIINFSRNGNDVSSDIKKQLANDYKNLAGMKFNGEFACGTVDNVCLNKDKDGKTKMMSKKDFNGCLNGMRICLQNQYREYNEAQRSPQKREY